MVRAEFRLRTTDPMSYDIGSVVRDRRPRFAIGRAAYAPGATDPVSAAPDDRVTKHEMNVSPWSHVAWSGA